MVHTCRVEYGNGVLVGERGQITIEKPIRERLGVRPRDVAVQTIENGRLVVTFVPGPHRRSLLGALAGAYAPVGPAPVAVPPASEDEAVARGVAEDEPASARRPQPAPAPGEDAAPR